MAWIIMFNLGLVSGGFLVFLFDRNRVNRYRSRYVQQENAIKGLVQRLAKTDQRKLLAIKESEVLRDEKLRKWGIPDEF